MQEQTREEIYRGSLINLHHDPTEIDRVQWMPLSEALARCRSGEIEDGKTLVGLYMTHYLLTSGHSSST